ncbi:HD domain-containing protein [Streptomyces sp. WAC05858]|nr:HD domain-containing protein [Streptomyces sp. WAC05858]
MAPARAGGEPVPPDAPPGAPDAADASGAPEASDGGEARGPDRPGPRDRDESAAQWPSRAAPAAPAPAAPRLPNALRGSLGRLAERHDRALHRARRQQHESAAPTDSGVRKGGVGIRWASRGASGREKGVAARERISGRRHAGLTVVAVYGAAGALAVVALVWTEWHGVRQPEAALAFGALIAVGEAIRCVEAPPALPGGSGVPDPRGEPAPVAAAGALAYALLGRLGGEPTTHGVLQVVTVVVAASLAGLVAPLALGCPVDPGHTARRALTVAFAAVCFQPLHRTGLLGSWFGHSPYLVGYLLALLVLTALCDAVLAAALARARTGWPYGPLLRDELRSLPGVAAAVCATAVVMPLTVAVAGLWPVPVLAVPLLLIQYSYRRYAGIRATYRQTIASLARSTEIAGYTPTGHAREVAALSRAVGRELGLSEPRLTVLEYAALMHDIGQLSLLDPVPAGATEPLPAAEQRKIALLGGAVVRQTGVPAEVAQVVERQADPYREQPLAARIVRAVNAYTELVSGPGAEGAAGAAALCALERLRLATARDFDPIVVETLATVLSRQVYGRPR